MRLICPRVLVLAAIVSSLAVVSVPMSSAATTQCTVGPSSAVFSAWGDQSLYTPFQGSTFENGAQGWSWGGSANIVNGDDAHLLGVAGSHSVQIAGGATAKSPHLCVDTTMPSIRLFIRRVSGSGNLTVSGTLDTGNGSFKTTVAILSATSTWAPTAPVMFPTPFTAAVAAGGLNAQFLFTADLGTTFRIDDIEMDPYRHT